ncbi:hypothetical protein B0H16DRAFT_1830175 [Mycena metata]|uniref:F-box domain-containing protein n=1 Tax=Mycena metata TaxID=1033252 RepID=A0AAD7KBP9_9AGAR|nr:hypothetical protein B0H16DRAFT_1830175 [Mycena metata]
MSASFLRTEWLSDLAQRAFMRHLVRSNTTTDPPKDLSSTISALLGELARYDVEISRLKDHLQGVELERAALQEYHDDCRCLLAPVRRLPAETLVEIFRLAVQEARTPDIHRTFISPRMAMADLANAPLLALSRVCTMWHDIAIGTPSLWEMIQVDSALWATPATSTRMMDLLRVALERSKGFSLEICIFGREEEPYDPALQLLAQHSERWRSLKISGTNFDLGPLVQMKGRLPQLESLSLWGKVLSLDGVFDSTPRLVGAQLACTPETWEIFAKLPLHQLQSLMCMEALGYAAMLGFGALPALSLMPHLRPLADFKLQLALLDPNFDFHTLVLPPITSAIGTLLLEFDEGFTPTSVGQTVAKILECLTLPHLTLLQMVSEEHPDLPIPWPQPEFLALAGRSSFHSHLLRLHLWHVVITEAELLECLAALPSLERLTVSDHLAVYNDGVEVQVVTDRLFAALTLAAPTNSNPDADADTTPPLAPRLTSFGCQTLLKFDDTVFSTFLLSRMAAVERDGSADSDDVNVVDAEVWWLPGHQRELDPSVCARLDELDKVKVVFGPAEESEFVEQADWANGEGAGVWG